MHPGWSGRKTVVGTVVGIVVVGGVWKKTLERNFVDGRASSEMRKRLKLIYVAIILRNLLNRMVIFHFIYSSAKNMDKTNMTGFGQCCKMDSSKSREP